MNYTENPGLGMMTEQNANTNNMYFLTLHHNNFD